MDWTLLLILPAVLIIGGLFVPFPVRAADLVPTLEGGHPLPDYTDFFGDSYLHDSIPGGVPGPLTAAMAATYMLVAVLGPAISRRFVTPSQAIRQRQH